MTKPRGSTILLRLALAGLATVMLVVCFYAAPLVALDDARRHPNTAYQMYLFLGGFYCLATPFFIAIAMAFKLLGLIDRSRVFSKPAVEALRLINNCALAIIGLTIAGLISLKLLAGGEDLAPFVTIAMLVSLLSGVIAGIADQMAKLVQNAIDVKSENDLTV